MGGGRLTKLLCSPTRIFYMIEFLNKHLKLALVTLLKIVMRGFVSNDGMVQFFSEKKYQVKI